MFQTHGFPPELFETLAGERNLAFDWKGFREEMERHGVESGGGQKVELFGSGPLDGPSASSTQRASWATRRCEVDDAQVVFIIANDRPCDLIDEDDDERPIAVMLDKTPFYGEMGGQVGDTRRNRRRRFPLRGRRHAGHGGFILHHGHLREGHMELGDKVSARVNATRREGIRRRIRPRTCCITPCATLGRPRPATGLEGGRRPAAFRLRQSRGRQRRRTDPRSRARSTKRFSPASRSSGRPCRWPRPGRRAR